MPIDSFQTSIRHSLSLIAVFQKRPRPITDPGKGHYWTVDFSKGEGNKRPRKRGRVSAKSKKAQAQPQVQVAAYRDDGLDTLNEAGYEDHMYADSRAPASCSGPDRTRDWRQSSHETARLPRKAPYPVQTQTQTQYKAPLLRRSVEWDDEFLSSEYSTPSNRETSLPPLQLPPLHTITYTHVYDNDGRLMYTRHRTPPGHSEHVEPDYARSSGYAAPALATDTSHRDFHYARPASIADAMDRGNYSRTIYRGPTSRADPP